MRTVLRQALAALSIMALSVAQATERCNTELVTGPRVNRSGSIKEQFIGSHEGGVCRFRRISIPNYDCTIGIGDSHHGVQYFSCGDDLDGLWSAENLVFQGLAQTTVGASRKVSLPKHTSLRKQWLAPIDTEGLHKNYPILGDDYTDFYPKIFSQVGPQRKLTNTDFAVAEQTFRYTTMKGEKRAAVTGQLRLGCFKMYFLSWVSDDKASSTEKDMANFLQDVRLEDVPDPKYCAAPSPKP